MSKRTNDIMAEAGEENVGRSNTPLVLSGSSSKRGPLSSIGMNSIGSQGGAPPGNMWTTPVKRIPPKLGISSSKAKPSPWRKPPAISKEEVQATDEGRASVHKLSNWLATESARKAKPKKTIKVATPVLFRMKPKISREDVVATDEKRVSVKKISEWISDDPFEKKRVRQIRSGAKVIAKARKFEACNGLPSSRHVEVKVGSVHKKQEWLTSAFKSIGECEEGWIKASESTEDKRPCLHQRKTIDSDESPEKKLKTVNHKQEWLSNAFKKESLDIGLQPTKSEDNSDRHCPADIMKCNSADIESSAVDYHRGSGIKEHGKANNDTPEPPVRLYQNETPVQKDHPEMNIKTLHHKQEWLANAFKKQNPSGGTGKGTTPQIHPRTPKNALLDETPGTLISKSSSLEETKRVLCTPGTSNDAKPARILTAKTPESDMGKGNFENGKGGSCETTESISAAKLAEDNTSSVADRAKWLRGAFK